MLPIIWKMGRKTSREKKIARERQVAKAINAYKTEKIPPIRGAATYGVPYTTLQARLRGWKNWVLAHNDQQKFTPWEEKAIVDWCSFLDKYGFPPRMDLVWVQMNHVLSTSTGEQIGKNLLAHFLRWHPNLKVWRSSRLNKQHRAAADPKTIRDYFSKVSLVLWL